MRCICLIVGLNVVAAGPAVTCDVDERLRSDCGFSGVSEEQCVARGCCWKAVDPNPLNTPWCFHNDNRPSPVSSSSSLPPPSTSLPPHSSTSLPPPSPPFKPRDASNPSGASDAFVHLFEWSWNDIAIECEEFLGPKGFTAVQISPPNDHISGDSWWTRYQPVTYKLISRSGNEEQFIDMVNRCKKAGVGIYADAVINHIAASSGTSIAGNSYGARSTPIYSQGDMHHNNGDTGSNCQISNYADKHNVQYCDLVGLPDLCTGCEYVQRTVAEYLDHMGRIGIAGFRIDAAKHQDATELGQLLSRVNRSLWKFGEVISGGGEAVTPQMYTSIMDVTEFNYARKLDANFQDADKLQYLNTFGESWGMMPSDQSVVFIDNHDTQRGGAPLTYKDGALYSLINVFMLAHPYGYPKVMSSYYFSAHDQGPPGSAVHADGRINCGNGQPWVCEHRWTAIANMVNWRRSSGTAPVSHFEAPGGNTVAFCRGRSACIALNRGNSDWVVSLTWPLPPGRYCDIIQSDDDVKCPAITVSEQGTASLRVPPLSAVALHVGKMSKRDEVMIQV